MKNRNVVTLLTSLMALVLIFMASCNASTPSESKISSSTAAAVKTEPPKTTAPPVTSAQVTNPPQAVPPSTTPLPAVPKTTTNSPFPGTIILGSPTADSITLSLLNSADTEAYIEYGKASGNYSLHTSVNTMKKDQPLEIVIPKLEKDTQYYYRVCHRVSGQTDYSAGTDSPFHTQRAVGSTFTFGVQGDSHPERSWEMFNSDLYRIEMNNVKTRNPDFYLTMGDDFMIDPLIASKTLSDQSVGQVYAKQRDNFGLMSSPLFLVNGNWERGAKYMLDGTPNNPAVFAGKARTQYYPLPAPGVFYSGNTENVPFIGLLKDYYAWTWGDALFVVIDFYWHSPTPVDNVPGVAPPPPTTPAAGGAGGAAAAPPPPQRTNMWDITLGETQYKWFQQTLASSKAKYKFVFSHHVLGTGRGGIENAGLYEWGGKNQSGVWEFDKMRPGWEMPIHQLMVKYGVNIFFQGHDHLYAHQVLDGVTYQEVPNPADNSYRAFNSNAYRAGDVLPNAGFLNVTVSSDQVKVDYVSSYLPKDETEGKKNGQVTSSYILK